MFKQLSVSLKISTVLPVLAKHNAAKQLKKKIFIIIRFLRRK